jgi:ATP-dependent DNA helicase RecG
MYKKFLEDLDFDVQYVKGVGPQRSKLLNKLGINTAKDLLTYFPKDWEDRRFIKKIRDLIPNTRETVQGIVVASGEIVPRPNLTITKVAISDETGTIYAVWFNQPYMKEKFKKGSRVILSGKVEFGYSGFKEIPNPEYEIIEEDTEGLNTGRITPIYSLTEGLTQRILRSIIKNAIDKYANFLLDILPKNIIEKYNFLDFSSSLLNIHFPEDFEHKERARERLVFEEFFLLQVCLALRKNSFKKEKGISFKINENFLEKFYLQLPFELTDSQKKVIEEIKEDMKKDKPMNRLIQGDVGSGKTVLAIVATLICISNGYQAAIMAPTEILAEQHYLNVHKILENLGIKTALLVGSLTKREKERIIRMTKSGEINLLIGTHALIQEGVSFKNLGLAIVDEQHRFGVLQRHALKKMGYNPDMLVMTATPIPRTLALTVYGDLDISTLKELPKERKPIITKLYPFFKREKVYQFIREQIKKGAQAYIVCPLIEESKKLDIQAATKLAEHLQKEVFPDLRIGLLHSRMKTKEKEEVMEKLRNREIDILTSTTVIEVGIDIPNATIMLIENAERFGLAQLHQLRGRVGRGKEQSYCILLSDIKEGEARERLEVLLKSSDGFLIAEEDLKLRGPGEFYGTRQHGMPDLKIADILGDTEILKKARKEAFQLVEDDPNLKKEENRLLKIGILKKYKNLELISVG